MLQSQLEIQEQTFENISREIHDNIGQKLTLAKLHLNTLHLKDEFASSIHLDDSILMISEAINDLSDISRSMSSEIILNNGLIKGLEFEVAQLNKSSLYNIELIITGDAIFLSSQTELVLFRIVQEALNNIMKHSLASIVEIHLHYNQHKINLEINDDGKGFITSENKLGTGISNMCRRAQLLSGKSTVSSCPGKGTQIQIEIPIHGN
ncbi:MAG: ATP-binding protein [Ferruginibacter sp.]